MIGALDISGATDFATDAGTAVATLGAAYLLLLGSTQVFPFVAAWIKRMRAGASGK